MTKNDISRLEQQRQNEKMKAQQLAFFSRAARDKGLKRALEMTSARHMALYAALDAQLK